MLHDVGLLNTIAIRQADEFEAKQNAIIVRLRAADAGFFAAQRKSLKHYLDAGDALNDARALIGRGLFHVFVREYCGYHIRAAEDRMRLAKHRQEVEAHLAENPELGLTAALKLIAKRDTNGWAVRIEKYGASGYKPPTGTELECEQALRAWVAQYDHLGRKTLLKSIRRVLGFSNLVVIDGG